MDRENKFGRKSKDIFVMTCGGSIGNADKYIKILCNSKNMEYLGCFPIVMPQNYIALASTPTYEEALKIIHQAEDKIDKVIRLINCGNVFPKLTTSLKDRVNSSVINDLYYPIFVRANNFSTTNACISCGECVNICPLNNICIEDEKPIWGKDCTHCMACICRCRKEAIEYGKRSASRVRYICPK